MKITEKSVFILSAIFVLFGAIFSDGFYHLDEHYQILEFASFKLGISGLEDMPWEFHEKMRPTMQPWIAYWTHKTLHQLGNNNPLFVAMTLRIISGIMALFTAMIMFRSFQTHYKEQDRLLLLGISLLLWFNPYLMVRFSSENWGGMFFFIATALLVNRSFSKTWKFWLVGLLLGLSFFIRFQMAFAIAGLIGFLLFSKKTSLKSMMLIAGGGITAIITMVLLDCLFYESLVFTPWEYFKHNIIFEKAASFGVDPWWMYFGWFIEEAFLPIALMSMFGLYQLLRNKELAILNWIWIPFMIGHFAVGHKELRFLFPLVYILPYAIIEAWQKISPILPKKNTFFKVAMIGILTWNFGLFIYSSLTPAKSSVRIYAASSQYIGPNSIVYLASYKNEEWNYPLKYFLDPSINVVRADSNVAIVRVNDLPHYVWVKKSQIDQNRAFLGDSITATIPQWVYYFDFNGWVGREQNYVLFEVKE